MARQFEAAAPLGYGLGVQATVLVVLKLKRSSSVLPCQAPWRSKVVLSHLPLWRGIFRMYALKFALYYGSMTLTRVTVDCAMLALAINGMGCGRGRVTLGTAPSLSLAPQMPVSSVPVAQWSERYSEHNLMCLVRHEAVGIGSTPWPL
jgi:hypothetical protein